MTKQLSIHNSYIKIPTHSVMVLGGKGRPLGGNRMELS